MQREQVARLLPYFLASGVVWLTLLFRQALSPYVGQASPFITFVPAVLVGAWFGGLWAGVFATALSTAVANYYLLQPVASWRTERPEDRLSLVLFVGVGLVVSWLTHLMRNAQSRAARNAERLRLALEAGHMASWEQDLGSGRIQWSHGSARLFGPVAAEAESSIDGFLAIVHQGDRERLRQTLREVAASRGDMEVTFRILDTAGHPRWVRAWGKVIQWRDGHQRLVCIGVDLTQSIELQQALARHTRELARSNEALAQFAYTASHDLQEPLRTVVSFTQLLSKRYAGKLGAEADEFMEFIVSGARRMSRLVGGLLEYSRTAETPPNNDAPVDMEAQLAEVLRALAASIAASGAEITHDPLPKVRGDRTAIAQVLLNLITNAIKYRGDAPPRIHVSSEPAGSDFYTFSIRDNGIGFDPRYRDRIFGVFKRLHATGYEGVGIGLAIAKKAVERHNGRIWAESEPGKGAVFHFTLPSATAMRE